MIRILFIGDIFGNIGISAITQKLPKIKAENQIDYIIANAENTTECRGLSKKDYDTLMSLGINFFTMGNHTWHKKEIYDILNKKDNIIRPLNLKAELLEATTGVGTRKIVIKNTTFQITNLLGDSVSVNQMQTNPFLSLEALLPTIQCDFHIVDFHCETTSEKNAFFIAFKSKVSAILGTHTHVQTNDYKIIDNTAYISDIGMTGPCEGVIGASYKELIPYFRKEKKLFHLKQQKGKYQFCAVVLAFDEKTHKVVMIKPIYEYEQNYRNTNQFL